MNKSILALPIKGLLHFVAVTAMLFGTRAVQPLNAQDVVIVNVDAVQPVAAPAEKADKNEDAKNPPAAKAADDEKATKPADDAAHKQAKPEAKPRPATQPAAKAPPGAAQHEAPAFALNVVPAVANQIAVEKQIRARLEPMLKVELSFANRAAGLNHDERRALIAASKTWLDEFVVGFVRHQDPNQRQMWLQGMVVIGGPQVGDDPRESIQHGVAEVVAATLPEDKAAAYKTECEKRTAFYHEVIVENLVDLIDAKVILTPDQRRKITASLVDHWDPKWAPQLELFGLNNDMWPSVPDQWVSPELTESQRSVLSTLNHPSSHMIINGPVFGLELGEIDDIGLDDAPPQADNKQHD